MSATCRLARAYRWSRREIWTGPTIAEAIVHLYMLRVANGEDLGGPDYLDIEEIDAWAQELSHG